MPVKWRKEVRFVVNNLNHTGCKPLKLLRHVAGLNIKMYLAAIHKLT